MRKRSNRLPLQVVILPNVCPQKSVWMSQELIVVIRAKVGYVSLKIIVDLFYSERIKLYLYAIYRYITCFNNPQHRM